MHVLSPPPPAPTAPSPDSPRGEPLDDEGFPSMDRPIPYEPRLHDWVDATPFRAHLMHLTFSTGLPWPAVAVASGLSLRLADRLLHARQGRRLRRIPPLAAIGLMAWSPVALDASARSWLPAYHSGRLARQLVGDGWDPGRLARFCQLEETELLALLTGRSHGCRLGTTWSLEAAERVLEARRPARAAAA